MVEKFKKENLKMKNPIHSGLINIVALIFCIQFFAQCSSKNNDAQIFSRDQLAIEKGTDVEIIYSDSAKVKVRVTGKKMNYFTESTNPRQEFPEGVIIYFYDDNQKQIGILTAKYGIRDERKRTVTARDSAVWTSIADGKLETDELYWDEKTNKVRSTKFTTITRAKEKIYGFDFETDDKLSHWLLKNPKGTMKVQSPVN